MSYNWANLYAPVEDKKYIQVNILTFLKKCGKDRDKYFKIFTEHHCQPYRKDCMFVYERFFTGSEITNALVSYLVAKGYAVNPEYEEGDPLMEGFDGVLMNVTW